MDKEFVPYEQALALKEFGFDEPCFRLQNNISNIIEEKGWLNWNEVEQFVSFPLYQQAFKFFREKYKLQSSVDSFCLEEFSFCVLDNRNKIFYPGLFDRKLLSDGKRNPWEFDTYEEAELECLKKLIEIVKNIKKNG